VLYCNILNRDKSLDADRLLSELRALQAQCRPPQPLHYNRLCVLFKPHARHVTAVKSIEDLTLERSKLSTDLLKLQVRERLQAEGCKA
jgi:hypothetical protein